MNSFVNGVSPTRYLKTDSAQVYYKKLEVVDECEYDGSKKALVIELEDTPGSERGNDDDEEAAPGADDGGEPTIKTGSRVIVLKDVNRVRQAFKKQQGLMYRSAIDSMCGREFAVKSMSRDGTVGLPSPDGAVWQFPKDAVELKVSLDLPIDTYLAEGEHAAVLDKKSNPTRKERMAFAESLQHPFQAYDRPIRNPKEDGTLGVRRMGYMICFDLGDPQSDSLKEAMTVHGLLTKQITNPRFQRLEPVIMLIGCQCDKTASDNKIDLNSRSAKVFAESKEIPFRTTSARNFENVQDVFVEMLQSILAREGLWTLEGPEDEDERGEEDGGCTVM